MSLKTSMSMGYEECLKKVQDECEEENGRMIDTENVRAKPGKLFWLS
jgi:hypothetical protein